MGKIINILIVLALFFYIMSFDKPAPKTNPPIVPTSMAITTTSTTISPVLNYSAIKDQIRWINRTVYDIIEINITNITHIKNITYETMNMTGIQQKSLRNMKPDQCFTAGCSDGFDKAKRECLSILDLKAPKFRETFGTGYDPFLTNNDSQACFLYDPDEGSIPLNGTYWYVTVPYIYQYINETVVRNGTYKIIREEIKIRRIDDDMQNVTE